ncbi:hypothetical protein ACP70R_031242 [Stipagrostis hirtigluma subsp. patula]
MSQRKGTMAVNSKHEEEMELRRGPWTLEEDNLLMNYIACHGEGRWNLLARCSGLKRTGKSCRLRWLNYLKPDIKRGNLTPEEQLLILELHSKWGNRWSRIAQHLPGRTDNEIKNYWRTRVQKQARQLRVDANSAVFRDAVRCYWMPRLLEKMASSASELHAEPPPPPPLYAAHGHGHDMLMAASPSPMQNVPASGSGCYVEPTPSTSTSGSGSSAAALPPVPCFSELSWIDQYGAGELDGCAAGVFDSAGQLGSLGLDGLDLGPADCDYSDSTLLHYLNSTCTGSAMTTMMLGNGNTHSSCGAMGDGDYGGATWRTTDELCQAARKLGGQWGGGI